MKQPSLIIDAGLQEIQDWHDWFVTAHTQRLATCNYSAEQLEHELSLVTRAATAITDRMRSDYLARRGR